MDAERQIEFLESERQSLKEQKFYSRKVDFNQRIDSLPRLFQHRIAFMRSTIEQFDVLYLEDVLTSLEWAVKIAAVWTGGTLASLPKDAIDRICGVDESKLDWKYFALVMAIALNHDKSFYFCSLDSSLVMTTDAPLPILKKSAQERDKDLRYYISTVECQKIELKFFEKK